MAVNQRSIWTATGLLGVLGLLGFGAYAAVAHGQIEPTGWIVGATSLVFVIQWLYFDRAALGATVQGRSFQYSGASFLVVIVGLAVAVAANVLAHRYDKHWDLTSKGTFTLSEQAKQLASTLDKPVEVIAFFATDSPDEKKVKDLADLFKAATDKLSWEFHDPVREPMLTEQYKITTAFGTLILKQGDNQQRLETDFDEQAIVDGLVRLTSGNKHLLCFATGHDELDPSDDSGAAGLGATLTKLKGQNYDVEQVTLLREGSVPTRCEAFIVADPATDWLPAEREMLAAYLAGGGKAVVMLEPTHTPELAKDLARYGVDVGDDLVLEQNVNYQLVGGDISYIIVDQAGMDRHPITDKLGGGMVLLRAARSVRKTTAPPAGVNVQEILRTSAQGWAERTLDPSVPPQPDPDKDLVGSVALATVSDITDPAAIVVGSRSLTAGAAATGVPGGQGDLPPAPDSAASAEVPRKAGGKLIVLGDSDFATNELVDQLSNRDLLLNTLAWLCGEEKQMAARPEMKGDSITLNPIQTLGVWFVSVVAGPGVALMGAVLAWRRRRAL